MKPIATGTVASGEGLRNDDAQKLLAASNVAAAYPEINPYVFAPPVAPHLAAAAVGGKIELQRIAQYYAALAARSDRVVVEGAGGWLVPLSDRHTMADLARFIGLPVVLVVAIRLGCLNHALLTARSIADSGVKLAGWVANQTDPHMAMAAENITSIQQRVAAPLLATIPYHAGAGVVSAGIDLDIDVLEHGMAVTPRHGP
jgi:dethiobiotin synthetase